MNPNAPLANIGGVFTVTVEDSVYIKAAATVAALIILFFILKKYT